MSANGGEEEDPTMTRTSEYWDGYAHGYNTGKYEREPMPLLEKLVNLLCLILWTILAFFFGYTRR